MTYRNSRPAVQNSYPDAHVAGFPGQLADMRSVSRDPHCSYATETDVYVGRAVVKGATSTDQFDLRPFGVKAPLATSVAGDLVGIVGYTYAADLDAEGAAYVGAKALAAIIEPGQDVLVYVLLPENTTIAHGDAVYVAIDATNDADIPVGALANAAGAGLIEWSAATWHKQVGPELGVIKI
jgi:hypothetical protein